MSQSAVAVSAPVPFWRRAFDWWLTQVKHVLPPTIFFFVGFNLILWTKARFWKNRVSSSGAFSLQLQRPCSLEKRFW